jgi:hypothetical protein
MAWRVLLQGQRSIAARATPYPVFVAAAVCARAPVRALQLRPCSSEHPHRLTAVTRARPVCRGHGCGHAHPPQRAPHAPPPVPPGHSGDHGRARRGTLRPTTPTHHRHGRLPRAPRVVHPSIGLFAPSGRQWPGHDQLRAPSVGKAGPRPHRGRDVSAGAARGNSKNGQPTQSCRGSHRSKGRLRRGSAMRADGAHP